MSRLPTESDVSTFVAAAYYRNFGKMMPPKSAQCEAHEIIVKGATPPNYLVNFTLAAKLHADAEKMRYTEVLAYMVEAVKRREK